MENAIKQNNDPLILILESSSFELLHPSSNSTSSMSCDQNPCIEISMSGRLSIDYRDDMNFSKIVTSEINITNDDCTLMECGQMQRTILNLPIYGKGWHLEFKFIKPSNSTNHETACVLLRLQYNLSLFNDVTHAGVIVEAVSLCNLADKDNMEIIFSPHAKLTVNAFELKSSKFTFAHPTKAPAEYNIDAMLPLIAGLAVLGTIGLSILIVSVGVYLASKRDKKRGLQSGHGIFKPLYITTLSSISE